MTLEHTIRQAIRCSGQSVTSVARAAGVPQPVLHRFVCGEQTLTLPTAEKLVQFFGLRLVPKGDCPNCSR